MSFDTAVWRTFIKDDECDTSCQGNEIYLFGCHQKFKTEIQSFTHVHVFCSKNVSDKAWFNDKFDAIISVIDFWKG